MNVENWTTRLPIHSILRFFLWTILVMSPKSCASFNHISAHDSIQVDLEDMYEDGNHVINHKHHKQEHTNETNTITDHTEHILTSEQHSSTTSNQPTLHDTWRLNLCIQDLGYSRNGILAHGPRHQGPRTLLITHTDLWNPCA